MILRTADYLKQAFSLLTLVLLGAMLCIGLLQPAAHAAPALTNEATTAEQAPETLSEKRAERRQIQSQASRAADLETEADSFEDVIKDKLNLDEIVEENVLLDGDANPDGTTPFPSR